jgi:hypothetical protein
VRSARGNAIIMDRGGRGEIAGWPGAEGGRRAAELAAGCWFDLNPTTHNSQPIIAAGKVPYGPTPWLGALAKQVPPNTTRLVAKSLIKNPGPTGVSCRFLTANRQRHRAGGCHQCVARVRERGAAKAGSARALLM